MSTRVLPEQGIATTGIPALDHILDGGLVRNRLCLVDPSEVELTDMMKRISVMKKRGGQHERTVREFRGVLTGVPVPEGQAAPLADKGQA